MAGFYGYACNMDAMATPWLPGNNNDTANKSDEKILMDAASVDKNGKPTDGLYYYKFKGHNLYAPMSLFNDHTAINYRTIYNGYPEFEKDNKDDIHFTDYDDYDRCMNAEKYYRQYLEDMKHPTVQKILAYYSDPQIDPYDLAAYKAQDFLYCKYLNQVPLNQMITLRRYIRPCSDRMFGLDMTAEQANTQNGYIQNNSCIATAVTFMGERTGNKLSDILKYSIGQKYENKQAQVQAFQSQNSGLGVQLSTRGIFAQKVSPAQMEGTAGIPRFGGTAQVGSAMLFSAAVQGKGLSVDRAMASAQTYGGDAWGQRYGNNVYGDLNVIDQVNVRSRGLTFENSFNLVFEYELKSYRFVNPRVAMLDIIINFMLLVGNYGTFWGGANRFYSGGGANIIAPQYGDPMLLRQGKYGQYMESLKNDIEKGFKNVTPDSGGEINLKSLLKAAVNIVKGGFENLLGNFLGGNIGVPGQGIVAPALLSGNPSGNWHLTVGNPLNPIVMMGNMCIEKTDVEFSETLGYDDFPNAVKFTVGLKHGRPRDVGDIESMFNAGKGRIYVFTDSTYKDMQKATEAMKMAQFTGGGDTSGGEGDGRGFTRKSGKKIAYGNSAVDNMSNEHSEAWNATKAKAAHAIARATHLGK